MKKQIGFIILLLFLCFQSLFAAEKSNIIFILADDQGYGDLSCYGSTVINTPNIDGLADQGMKFTIFYVHNRCSPTRPL